MTDIEKLFEHIERLDNNIKSLSNMLDTVYDDYCDRRGGFSSRRVAILDTLPPYSYSNDTSVAKE